MEEEKWWAGEDRAPTLRPLLVRGQGNEICRKPKGIRKFRETLSHGCTANMICASLRSGGRRLAVRTAMEHPIGALPRTPFPASRDFAPMGSMSLDFQVASLSYKSSSFATSRGNERYEGKNSESYTSRTISAFPPFGGWRHHLPAPVGSVSLDSQSPTAPCESSSLATTSWWDYGCLAMEPCLYRKA